jgi:uncharacterized protein (DUF1499 family)
VKKIIIALVVIFVVFVVAILFIGRTFYPDNVAETSVDGGTKGLKTRIYKTDFETAKKTVKEIIPTLSTYGSTWQVTDQTDSGNMFGIKAEVPVIVFTDDLEVNVKNAENEGEVQVDVVSKSRVGKSDFGENARHVRKVLGALDEKLKKQPGS